MTKCSYEGVEVDCVQDAEQILSDGTRLFADIYRPRRQGPCPVLLCRTPYDKRTAQNYAFAHPIWYARHGYIVVVQDVRGRWRSGGDFYPFAHESADGAEAVEWAARLEGSNGRVGMYGFSYTAATQLLAARQRPPSLQAISPAMAPSQFYDGCIYQGGVLSLAFAVSWAASLAAAQALRRGDDDAFQARTASGCAEAWSHLPLKTFPGLRAAGAEGEFFFDWLDHPGQDEYWLRWSLENSYAEIDVPALHLGGWYDIFLRGTLQNFTGLKAAALSTRAREGQHLVVGPWLHMPWTREVGSMDFGLSARNLANQWQLAFFDQYLKEKFSSEANTPVTVFVMGENCWRHFDTWPPAASRLQRLYLHSNGLSNTSDGDGTLSPEPPEDEPSDVFIYMPLAPVPSAGGASCCFASIAPMGPVLQSTVENNPGVLIYTAEILEKDFVIVGPVRVYLWAVSSAQDTDFTAKLCLVQPDGTSNNLSNGILRARYRDSLREHSFIEPGRAYLYQIDLGATAINCHAGTRLRLQVSSSDFPHWDRNLNTGGTIGEEGPSAAVVATQIVLHERAHASYVEFSVLGE